jgi:hypothetical protein
VNRTPNTIFRQGIEVPSQPFILAGAAQPA